MQNTSVVEKEKRFRFCMNLDSADVDGDTGWKKGKLYPFIPSKIKIHFTKLCKSVLKIGSLILMFVLFVAMITKIMMSGQTSE